MKRENLGALIHFEAVARLGSFTSAAVELNLSQGAVSQQVRALELRLGRALLLREHARLRLTAEGKRLLPAVQLALTLVSDAWAEVQDRRERRILKLAALPTFASYWLIPKIAAFRATHLNIELEVHSLPADFVRDSHFPKLDNVAADIAFTYGDGAWPGMQSLRLFDERMLLACSPRYLAAHPITNIEHLASATLIQHTTRPNMWQEWANQHGPRSLAAADGPRFEHFFMIAQAARADIGVALLPEFVLNRELASGALVRILPHSVATRMSYHAVWTKAAEDNVLLRTLLAWLTSTSSRCSEPTRQSS